MIRTSERQKVEMEHAIGQENLRWNEKVWTLLVADAIDQSPNKAGLIADLCGAEVAVSGPMDLWFEAQPFSPRAGSSGIAEGNTHLDLALGHVRERAGTDGGITYGPPDPASWVCFVEAKCLADCSHNVSYDPLRNQVARVIENLLCFQSNGVFPEHLFFTLLTPRLFKEDSAGRRSRLYAYKFNEYVAHPDRLLDDLTHCRIPRRDTPGYTSPQLEARIERLHLNWITIESVLEQDWGHSLDVVEIATNRREDAELRERLSRAVGRLRQG